jgi:hypothetical protein
VFRGLVGPLPGEFLPDFKQVAEGHGEDFLDAGERFLNRDQLGLAILVFGWVVNICDQSAKRSLGIELVAVAFQ